MGFMDLINGGVDSIKKAYNDKKDSIKEFDFLITNSTHLENLLPYEVKNPSPSEGREQMILSSGLTINVENSKLINKLIPFDETILNTKSSIESKTRINYFFVITDKKLWVLNKQEYRTFEFNEIQNFQIINKALISQGVKFNNNAFSFEGMEGDITKFGLLLLDARTRLEETKKATEYLCGIVPRKQVINMHLSGITFGDNGQMVLHNGKVSNKLINIKDIEYVQLLLDNAVILTKGKTTFSQVSQEVPCRKMSMKFVLKDSEYIIDVMPENLMGTLVRIEDSTFQKNIHFARDLMNLLEGLIKKY